MKFIHRDTNIWIHFECIGKFRFPFQLPREELLKDCPQMQADLRNRKSQSAGFCMDWDF